MSGFFFFFRSLYNSILFFFFFGLSGFGLLFATQRTCFSHDACSLVGLHFHGFLLLVLFFLFCCLVFFFGNPSPRCSQQSPANSPHQTIPSKSTTVTFPIATARLSDKISAHDTRNDTRPVALSCYVKMPLSTIQTPLLPRHCRHKTVREWEWSRTPPRIPLMAHPSCNPYET